VFLLAVGLLCVAYTPYARQRGEAMLRARTCTAEQVGAGATETCFVPVTGHMTGRFSRGEWRFTPDFGRRDAHVSFAHDNPYDTSSWTPQLARLLGGEATTALYWGKDPVAFLVDGKRVDTLGFGSSTVMVGLWGGIMGLSFGTASLRVLLRRPTGRPALALTASGVAALTLVVVDVAAAPPWPAEALVWATAVTGVLLLPRRWVGAWAERVARQRG
jgi:hypothetical protein